VWPHHRETVDSGAFQFLREHGCASAIRVRLHDSDEFDRADARFEARNVRGYRIEVNLDPGVEGMCDPGEGAACRCLYQLTNPFLMKVNVIPHRHERT
jgi:hypothetical protein